MDLTPYVDNLRRELAVAAEVGGEDARELAPGSVDVRLRGAFRRAQFLAVRVPFVPQR